MQAPDHQTSQQAEKSPQIRERPTGLSILLMFSFVYNGILFGLMITGLIYQEVVKDVIIQYFPSSPLSNFAATAITLSGVLVFGISLAGLIFLWMYRRMGFYLYAAAQATMLVTLIFVLKSYDFINISIAVIVVVIFGLYSRGMK